MIEYYLREDLAVDELAELAELNPQQTNDTLLGWARSIAYRAAPGDIYRHKEGRTTLRFEYNGRSYFLKLHLGIGWVEIIKNLLQLRLPVLGAINEYLAVAALERAGVDTLSVAAYACRGRNPAAMQSMIVTDELAGTVSLEDYCADWVSAPPDPRTRMRLILKLADSAQRMHRAGINHRDFYICHFHLDESTLAGNSNPRCYLIDLHRAQIRPHTPRRWQVKDLAALYFSAMDCGLTRRDMLRFMHHYSEGGLRKALGQDAGMWRQVARRGARLYRKASGTAPPLIDVAGRASSGG